MTEPLPPPDGFEIGHWTDSEGSTGCTAVLAPGGTRGGVDVRGGGPGTRETDVIGALAGTSEVTAVVLSGGSAFGLAAADGAMRWLEERGRGYTTAAGLVPIVPAAVIYDLAEGDPSARPGPDAGYAACEAAHGGVPERGRVGAGAGAAVGKILGRERSTPTGVGYAAARSGRGETVAALAVVNAFGDVIGDAQVLAGPRAEDGEVRGTAELIAAMESAPDWTRIEERNTTLVCVMTDAALDKPACSRAARMASGGVARAVDPVFSDADGDVAFCLASGGAVVTDRFTSIAIGTIAATVTAAAIRDAVL
ncbi:MAG: P1 family peptidase [Solirubrobacterales bacterium]